MYITSQFKRRIHIIGKPDDVRGCVLKVYDAETSEEILNITRIELLLDVKESNVAKITYYEREPVQTNQSHQFSCFALGRTVVIDGEPVQGTVTVDNPSLNLTAWELASDDKDDQA
jgi:hypothetical protein